MLVACALQIHIKKVPVRAVICIISYQTVKETTCMQCPSCVLIKWPVSECICIGLGDHSITIIIAI